jgi:hypothetical protein
MLFFVQRNSYSPNYDMPTKTNGYRLDSQRIRVNTSGYTDMGIPTHSGRDGVSPHSSIAGLHGRIWVMTGEDEWSRGV